MPCEDHRPFCAEWPDGQITITCRNCDHVIRVHSENLGTIPARERGEPMYVSGGLLLLILLIILIVLILR